MGKSSFRANECSSRFPTFRGTLLGRYLGMSLLLHTWWNTTSEDYLNYLQQVLQQLRVKLFKKEVSYLVRLVSSEGHTADPRNIAAVKSQIKAPTKIITELRSTLGLVGYFRRSIPNFSKAVNPLYFLIVTPWKVKKTSLMEFKTPASTWSVRNKMENFEYWISEVIPQVKNRIL